jgi:FHS family glucose/mannose:H+ symporter-like MFS transporter
MRKLFWFGCLSYFLIGLAHVVAGAVLPELLEHYGREYRDGGLLIFLQFIGFLIGVSAAPRIVARYGGRALLLGALGALAVSEWVYGTLPSWYVMLACAPVAGIGFGTIEAVVGAMIIGQMEERKAVAMGRLEMCFGLGALCMPIFAGVFFKLEVWSFSFTWVGLLAIVLLGFIAFVPIERQKTHSQEESKEAAYKLRSAGRFTKGQSKLVACFSFFFLLYVGLEMSLVNFLPPIVIAKLQAETASATFGVTCFWTAMSVGRYICGTLADRMGYGRYLLLHCIAGLAMTGILSLAGSLWAYYAVVSLLGFALSGIFGISLVYANHLIPGKEQKTTSWLVASGGIGGAAVPWLTGWWLDYFQAQAALLLLFGFAALLSGVMLLVVNRVPGAQMPSAG